MTLFDLLIVGAELLLVMLKSIQFSLDGLQTVDNFLIDVFTLFKKAKNIILILVKDFGSQNFTESIK